MAFELDPCGVHAPTGELVAEGFVREAWDEGLLVEAEHFTAHWLSPGDRVELRVMSAVRGECTYDAVVASSELRRIGLHSVRLRQAVQKRSAVRVLTSLPFRVTEVLVDGELVAAPEPFQVVVQDVSATGMRVVCDDELEVGTVLAFVFAVEDLRIPVLLQVVRSVPQAAVHSHGCVLVDLPERDADRLFAYVLAEQRRELAARAAVR